MEADIVDLSNVLSPRAINGHVKKLRMQGYDVRYWDAFVNKPFYYVEGTPGEADADKRIADAVQKMDMQETAVEAVRHFSSSHGLSIVEFLCDYDVHMKDGRPLTWNEMEWYKAITGAYESGKLNGVLTKEQRNLLAEARMGIVTEEDILLAGGKRLVDLQMLTRMGDGIYGYGICSYLKHNLLAGIRTDRLANGELGQLEKWQSEELGNLGLIEETGDGPKATPLGSEVFGYLGACPVDVSANRKEALEKMGEFWKGEARKEKDTDRRIDMFMKAARIYSKPVFLRLDGLRVQEHGEEGLAAEEREKVLQSMQNAHYRESNEKGAAIEMALKCVETAEQFYRVVEGAKRMGMDDQYPEDERKFPRVRMEDIETWMKELISVTDRKLDWYAELYRGLSCPIGAAHMYENAYRIAKNARLVDKAVEHYGMAGAHADAAMLLLKTDRGDEAWDHAEEHKAMKPFLEKVAAGLQPEERAKFYVLNGELEKAVEIEAERDLKRAKNRDPELPPEKRVEKIEGLRRSGFPVYHYEKFFTSKGFIRKKYYN